MTGTLKHTCICFACWLALGIHIPAAAQDPEMERISREYYEFRRRAQLEFAEFLKQSWQEFDLLKGEELPLRPEPETPLVAEPAVFDKAMELPSEETFTHSAKVDDAPLPKPLKNKAPDHYAEMAVGLFGSELRLPYDRSGYAYLRSTKEKDVGEFWEKLAQADFPLLLYACREVRDRLFLNDWGYYQLVKAVAAKVYPGNMENERTLFTAFILDETGYDVRCALVPATNRLTLMLSFTDMAYSVSYFDAYDRRYFMPGINHNEKLISYGNFPKGQKRRLNLRIYKPIRLKEDNRTFEIDRQILGVPLRIEYNRNAIEFYKTIPLTDLSVYFNSSGSIAVYNSLFDALKPVLENRTEKEAVGELLKFVQHAFQYKTDARQFGYERTFFYEELFGYPYSDCEDRAVLFAFLVKKLLGLPVVGVCYPGHVATAVKFTKPAAGNYVSFRDESYTICDPTYKNATIGQSMPGFETVQAKLIAIE